MTLPGDSNGSDKSSAAGANGLGESGSGGSEEGSDKGLAKSLYINILLPYFFFSKLCATL